MLVPRSDNPQLSVVIPCYNEQQVLPRLKERLLKSLPSLSVTWEVILVDDGSADETPALLVVMHREDVRFKVIRFSRNFGHQAAISAGLAHASGDTVAV